MYTKIIQNTKMYTKIVQRLYKDCIQRLYKSKFCMTSNEYTKNVHQIPTYTSIEQKETDKT